MSHFLPYFLVVAIAAAGGTLPEFLRPWLDPLRTLLAGLALLWFARHRAYPELGTRDTKCKGALTLAVLSGVAVGLIWMRLAEAVPSLGTRGGFDAGAAGTAAAPVLWGFRILGSVVVIPFAEELFVRSLLPRWVDAQDAWRSRAIGSFTAVSAAVSVAFFAGTHPEWLAALVTGVIWTLLLIRTGRLRDVVIAHAVANALLAVWVVATGETQWW